MSSGTDDKWCTPQSKDRSINTNIKHLWTMDNDKSFNPEVVLLGTSMFECLTEVPSNEELMKIYLGEYRVANFGCGGDRIGNILYRLEEGRLFEMLYQSHSPKLVILMAGANDIEYAPIPSMVAGMKRIINDIRKTTIDTHIAVMGIFPRLSKKKKLTEDVLYPKIQDYNQKLKLHVEDLQKLGDNISYHYCGDKILKEDGTIDRDNLFDLVHLSHAGNIILVQKLTEIVHAMLGPE